MPNSRIQKLHQKAIQIAKSYHHFEGQLIRVLMELDRARAYRHFKKSSLYAYAREVLLLSEDRACDLIAIARKGGEVPQLLEVLAENRTTISKARKVLPVINAENQDKWLDLIQTATKLQIERAVAEVKPETLVQERVRYRTKDRMELTVGISENLHETLQRCRDIIAQKTGQMPSIEETLDVLAKDYLEKHDPVQKSARSTSRQRSDQTKQNSDILSGSGRIKKDPAQRARLPRATVHALNERDGARCTHMNDDGSRCVERKWLHFHHIVPREIGGSDELSNLVTLCSEHHRWRHMHGFPAGVQTYYARSPDQSSNPS